jgi:hypothetical protein
MCVCVCVCAWIKNSRYEIKNDGGRGEGEGGV